jgi:hypothetical protein
MSVDCADAVGLIVLSGSTVADTIGMSVGSELVGSGGTELVSTGLAWRDVGWVTSPDDG